MSFPEPRPGLVIRYAYLWKREADAGLEEGLKERPCAIVVAAKRVGDRYTVRVLPLTHAPPRSDDEAIEIPFSVKLRLGLDAATSWVVLSESNVFHWPGPDLRIATGRGPESIAYGFLPPTLFQRVRDRYLALDEVLKGLGSVRRTE